MREITKEEGKEEPYIYTGKRWVPLYSEEGQKIAEGVGQGYVKTSLWLDKEVGKERYK